MFLSLVHIPCDAICLLRSYILLQTKMTCFVMGEETIETKGKKSAPTASDS